MKQFILGMLFVGISFFGIQTANAQTFNNHVNDCPTVGVATPATASNGCWATSVGGLNPGDEVAVGVYFHNTSPIDTSINVRLSDPRGGSGTSVSINGTITPASGSGAGGFSQINFNQPSRLEYVQTKVYWNGVGNNVTDTTGRVLSSGEPISLVPGQCANCGDPFLYQGVVKVYFRVVAATTNNGGGATTSGSPTWDPSSPQIMCNSNGTATVKIKGIGNGQQLQFKDYFNGGIWVDEQGNNSYTFYNVPSKSDVYHTGVRYKSTSADDHGVYGAFRVNCPVDTTPPPTCAIDQSYWDTNGYPRVEFLSSSPSSDVSVTVKAKNTGGRSIEFYNQATGRYESPNLSGDRIIWYNVLNTWPVNNTNGNQKIYRTAIRFAGCTEYATGYFAVTPQTVVDNTTLPSVQTQNPTDVAKNSATINGTLVSTGNAATQTYLYWGRRQGSVCTASDLVYKTPENFNANTGSFSRYISGLSTDTWYCYQAAASNVKGEVKGDIRSFKTTNDVVVYDQIRIETASATNVTSNYATLRGDVLDTGSRNYVNTWFEFDDNYNDVVNGNGTRYSVSGDKYKGNQISYNVNGLNQGTRYYYRACGENAAGERDCGDVLNFITTGQNSVIRVETEQPSNISYYQARLHGRVGETGQTNRLRTWFEYSTSQSAVYNGYGSRLNVDNNYYFSQGQPFSTLLTGLSPNTRYYYRACGDNTYGEKDCGAVETFVTFTNNVNPPVQNDSILVTTLAPSSVYQYSARLNGTFNARSCTTNLWYEYGRTSSLGEVVNIGNRASGDRGIVSASISGLKPNTTYYYRLVGNGCGRIVRGDIKTFRTGKTTVVTKKPPVKQKPVVKVVEVKEDVDIASESLCSPDLNLSIDDNQEVVTEREQFDYVINYQNLTKTYVLRDIQLQVEIPPQLEFVRSERGTYNNDSHSVFISGFDLDPSEGDSFKVTVRAKKGLVDGDLIVASATAAFISPTTGANDSSTDFDSNEYLKDQGRVIGSGSSSSSRGFLPTSLIGWLSLIFLVFLFIAALRWLWFSKKGDDYNYAYGPYGVPPQNPQGNGQYYGGYPGVVAPAPAPVEPAQPPVQPIYVPFNPNQPR